MVTFQRIPAAESRRLYQEQAARLPAPEPEPLPANVSAMIALAAAGRLLWRDRAFDVPPVPYREGIRLAQIARVRQRLLEPGDDPTAVALANEDNLRTIAAIAWVLVQPLGALGRLRKRLGLMRNPFRNASEEELDDLLRFLLMCRTRSRAQRVIESLGPDGPWT